MIEVSSEPVIRWLVCFGTVMQEIEPVCPNNFRKKERIRNLIKVSVDFKFKNSVHSYCVLKILTFVATILSEQENSALTA